VGPGDGWALHALAARGTTMVAPQRACAARALPAVARLRALAGRDAGAAPRGRARMVALPHGHRRERLGGVAGPRATGDGHVDWRGLVACLAQPGAGRRWRTGLMCRPPMLTARPWSSP